jgi:DNA-directed RNA polymerase specialized sigma24 family protein
MSASDAGLHSSPPPDGGFEVLLGRLAGDRDAAGERYEDLRAALTRFFLWRRCDSPEELADETLTRLARKLASGERVEDLFRYAHGVARLVMLEHLKEAQRRETALRDLASLRAPEPADERRLACLDSCLASLDPEARALLMAYYAGERSDKIENRKRLAESRGMTLFSLRVRVHRLRERLERCLGKC